MKKTILIISLIFQIYSAHCQDYYPLPESNVVWSMGWGESGCAQSGFYDDYQYLITGDTLIDSVTYQKIERSGSFHCHAAPISPEIGYMGAFRNNVVTRKVFFIPRDSLTEMLLYDFNLNIGDTVNGYLDMVASNNTAVISTIDSILIGNSYRKRWNYQSTAPYWDGTIVEGIGCEYGLLEGLCAMFDFNGSLHCFSVDNQTLYPISSPGPCALILHAPTIEEKGDNQIICSPNPASGSIQIRANNMEQIHSYIISDHIGRIILNSPFDPNQAISIENLMIGIYLIEFLDSDGQIIGTSKIIKTDGIN